MKIGRDKSIEPMAWKAIRDKVPFEVDGINLTSIEAELLVDLKPLIDQYYKELLERINPLILERLEGAAERLGLEWKDCFPPEGVKLTGRHLRKYREWKKDEAARKLKGRGLPEREPKKPTKRSTAEEGVPASVPGIPIQ
jgi:hypothetical protein